MTKAQKLADERFKKLEAIKALYVNGDDLSAEDAAKAVELMTEANALKAQVEAAEAQEIKQAAIKKQVDDDMATISAVKNRPPVDNNGGPGTKSHKTFGDVQVFSKVASVKNFTGTTPERDFKAYAFAQWMCGAVLKMDGPSKWCQDNGIAIKWFTDKDDKPNGMKSGQVESDNSAGGALVPIEFSNDIIILREKFGVFRQYSRIEPMASDIKLISRRTAGLTAYFTNEAGAITASQAAWDNVELIAKKPGVFVPVSSELTEDAMVNMADNLFGEIAYAFALKEDQCGFIGDGSATYGKITGITTRLKGIDATVANVAGLVVASGTGYGTSYNSIALSDFNKVVGLLPQYADGGNAAWFVHKFFWGSVMQKLAEAAGGVTALEVIEGARTPRFLGYPVVISQVLPKVSAINQVCALFGDLSMGTTMGDRRQVTLAQSPHYLFANDQIALRGTERFDINVHDVGDNAGNPGPIVGLITAAS